MTENTAPRGTVSPAAAIAASVVLFVIGVLAPAWPIILLGAVALIAGVVALAIRSRADYAAAWQRGLDAGAADALAARPNVTTTRGDHPAG